METWKVLELDHWNAWKKSLGDAKENITEKETKTFINDALAQIERVSKEAFDSS